MEEIETNIAKIRMDLDEYKKANSSDFRILRNDLFNKATKEESEQLEQRVGQQSDDMFAKLQTLFPEKDVVQRKLNKLDRQIK